MAYVCAAVRNELLHRLYRPLTYSLDEPYTPESTDTYLDMLPAPVVKHIEHNEKAAKVVHTALHLCSLEEQRYARDEFGLDDFKPLLTNWRDKPSQYHFIYENASRKNYLKAAVYGVLKMDRQVQAYVQREMAVL